MLELFEGLPFGSFGGVGEGENIFLAVPATETSGEVVSYLEDPTCSLNFPRELHRTGNQTL